MKIGPLFKWFGSKWQSAKRYPAPMFDAESGQRLDFSLAEKPVWMETWETHGDCVCSDTECGLLREISDGAPNIKTERVEIASAAPEMLRLLMELEDSGECPMCLATLLYEQEPHDGDCELDRMLTSLGFPDRTSRNAARALREMAK